MIFACQYFRLLTSLYEVPTSRRDEEDGLAADPRPSLSVSLGQNSIEKSLA